MVTQITESRVFKTFSTSRVNMNRLILHLGSVFLKVNQNGRVPALEDPNTGVVSWESGAIINSLLRVYDKNNVLGPRADSEQAQVDFDKWIFFLVSTLGPMMGMSVLLRRCCTMC